MVSVRARAIVEAGVAGCDRPVRPKEEVPRCRQPSLPAAAEAPASGAVQEPATATGTQAPIRHRGARVCADAGLLTEDDDQVFSLTQAAGDLREDSTVSLRDFTIWPGCRPYARHGRPWPARHAPHGRPSSRSPGRRRGPA
ncbi:hypothetical protein GCM10010320_76420 [Streptomyces caelestis]|nr:hypothetical protein GCM10010320_76420 [Streptomyces caelestis]